MVISHSYVKLPEGTQNTAWCRAKIGWWIWTDMKSCSRICGVALSFDRLMQDMGRDTLPGTQGEGGVSRHRDQIDHVVKPNDKP